MRARLVKAEADYADGLLDGRQLRDVTDRIEGLIRGEVQSRITDAEGVAPVLPDLVVWLGCAFAGPEAHGGAGAAGRAGVPAQSRAGGLWPVRGSDDVEDVKLGDGDPSTLVSGVESSITPDGPLGDAGGG